MNIQAGDFNSDNVSDRGIAERDLFPRGSAVTGMDELAVIATGPDF